MKQLILILTTVCCATFAARGDVVLSDVIGSSYDTYFELNTSNATALDTDYLAFGFQTGTSGVGGYYLDSVTLSFLDADVGTTGGISISLYTNAGNDQSPLSGTLVGTLSGDSTPTSAGDYEYLAVSSLLLADITSYWLVIDATAVSAGSYYAPASYEVDPTTSGWTSPSYPNGTAFQNLDGWTYGEMGYGAPRFVVEATAVPEPATGSLVLLALGASAWGARRRRMTSGAHPVGV